MSASSICTPTLLISRKQQNPFYSHIYEHINGQKARYVLHRKTSSSMSIIQLVVINNHPPTPRGKLPLQRNALWEEICSCNLASQRHLACTFDFITAFVHPYNFWYMCLRVEHIWPASPSLACCMTEVCALLFLLCALHYAVA